MKEEEMEAQPKMLDYPFEKELITKQNRCIHIMDTFGPSMNTHYLSTKFYARHEQQHIPQNVSAFGPFVFGRSIRKHNTEASMYGWMPEIINKPNLLKELNSINAPKQRCSLTIFGEKLQNDRANARPSYNGLRFILH